MKVNSNAMRGVVEMTPRDGKSRRVRARFNYNQLFFLGVAACFVIFVVVAMLLRSDSKGSLLSRSVSAVSGGEFNISRLGIDPDSAVHLQDFHRQEMKDGRPVWVVDAKDARYYASDGFTLVNDAVMTVYRSQGSTLKLNSPVAKLYMIGGALQRAELEGEILAVLNDSVQIKTDFANYDVLHKLVSAPGNVVIQGNGYEIRGVGMEILVDADQSRLLDQVSSRFEQGGEAPRGLEGLTGSGKRSNPVEEADNS